MNGLKFFKNTDLRAENDAVPSLIKQERDSLKGYFMFLLKLYKSPKEEISTQNVSELIINFASTVLKEYADNYNRMFHMGVNRPSQAESQKEIIELKQKTEELNRILVSVSSIISDSVFKTLRLMDDEDLKRHIKELTPLLID
mmetsp:Transcript_11816/g.13408  ORF Transcript_11816/g.13408 Transcript_11816/m.13408 type:complete len:143 (+) Transcript_11816:4887-5315(+)